MVAELLLLVLEMFRKSKQDLKKQRKYNYQVCWVDFILVQWNQPDQPNPKLTQNFDPEDQTDPTWSKFPLNRIKIGFKLGSFEFTKNIFDLNQWMIEAMF